jgi:uncharacterized protein YjiK
MRPLFGFLWLAGGIAVAIACGERSQSISTRAHEEELKARQARLAQKLGDEDWDSDAPLARWVLPRELREISGIALMQDGRLLAHNDENGIVYVLDPRKGMLLKKFMLDPKVHADFEGIATAGNVIYMLVSNGTIYELSEGEEGKKVRYKVHDTKLGKECEFEGIVFEPDSARLVMPCKVVGTKSLRDQLVFYRWRIDGPEGDRLSMMKVPLSTAVGTNRWKRLHPSDITIDPATGNYVVITGRERALLEITPGGQVVRSESLPSMLEQPEGVAITPDNILIVSDESTKQAGSINLFRWAPKVAPTNATGTAP